MGEIMVSAWVRPADLREVHGGDPFTAWDHSVSGHVQIAVPLSRVLSVASGIVYVGEAPKREPYPHDRAQAAAQLVDLVNTSFEYVIHEKDFAAARKVADNAIAHLRGYFGPHAVFHTPGIGEPM